MIQKFFICVLVLLSMSLIAIAQPGNAEMADTMRSNGKIYVVVAVVLTIFLCRPSLVWISIGSGIERFSSLTS